MHGVFRGIEPRTSTRTRIAYAYDLSVFFDFLRKENPVLSKLERMDITLDYLDSDYCDRLKNIGILKVPL